MRRLSFLVIMAIIFGTSNLSAQEELSPHGPELKIDCKSCHSTFSWEIIKEEISFNHDTFNFQLNGEHANVDCKSCHQTLVFEQVKMECASCHSDIHQQTLGSDCARCHNSNSWIVEDVTELHDEIGFPLLGVHAQVSCFECHRNDAPLRFLPVGTACIDCHSEDYTNTTNPNHESAGFSKDCAECHEIFGFDWATENVDHHFFPLEGAHDVADCAACHDVKNYSDVSSECVSCHQKDYDNSTAPNHLAANIGVDCKQCHTTDQGWTPAEFRPHDFQYFPIYSGAHQGVWTSCMECHNSGGDLEKFDCLQCHINPETDDVHQTVNGYIYQNEACLACHPTGSADETFDHNATNFPLTGAHSMTDCIACHQSGYAGTSTLCVDCHQEQFDQSVNPNHGRLNLTTDCASCHSTTPDWMPASFDIHDDYYELKGAHAAIRMDCAACHQGQYNGIPNTCFDCHRDAYEMTTDPDHEVLQFSQECTECHNESSWVPSTFDHDGQYFPIYSGKHQGEWTECVDCHTTIGDYSQFTCITCHMNPETDDQHSNVPGYSYNSESCLACHPTGDADEVFDHNATNFPLTGAHTMTNCIECHENGYKGTPTQCQACHLEDFQGSVNPNHSNLGISMDCATCHTTDPGWAPASFDVHDDYYALVGAHVSIRNDCAVCHNGDYNNTPNTCYACHQQDYDDTDDPPHLTLQFSQNCIECHGQDVWTPSTFDHDGEYFPIYSGKHMGEWVDCRDCHNNMGNYAEFTCVTCHMNPETDNQHVSVQGYIYQSMACLACHPTGEADVIFDHDGTNFPLTGEHQNTDCLACHASGFMGTPTECQACHTNDFNMTTNPNHQGLGISMDCAMCHTTEPGWSPASFDNHDDYYELRGAHIPIKMNCATCHNGDYNSTPNTCVGCHQSEYDATTNPPHSQSQFSTDCAGCHTEDEWEPSTFDHDGMYFPINSGTHAGTWSECTECHTNPMDYAEFSCLGCHEHNMDDMDEKHIGINGYSYNSISCFICHPTGVKDEGIDHDMTNFPLTGAHLTVACLDCHENGFQGTPTECKACHQDDFDQSLNPSHPTLGLSTDCMMCHTTDPGWAPAGFPDHDSYYALTGGHDLVRGDCAACHMGDYNNTPTDCDGCHLKDYNNTSNPNHRALNIPQQCDDCHTTEPGWSPASFDIHDNYYALTGAHSVIKDECAKCHMGDYNNTPNTCDGCHMADYNSSSNPNHPSLGIPTSCDNCHTTDPGWAPATFAIHDNYYPLTGAHDPIRNDCAKCHMGDYNNTPNTCDGCHMADYNTALDPNHSSLGLPTDCAMCHTTNPNWEPATFPIHDSYYPLNGAHAIIKNDCAKCHMGSYNNTPNTCYGCHKANYDNTTNPDHASAGFPTSCETCHNETAWTPSSWDHDNLYFPIYSGKHDNEWNQCVDCHTSPGNYSIFNCISCHEHNNKAEVDDDHDQVSGYSYNSNACFNCHPIGEK